MSFCQIKELVRGCCSREAIRQCVHPYLESMFGALKHRLFFFDEMELTKAEEARFLSNPVVESFFRTETALHESIVVSNSVWREYCPRADHGHVLMGPLVASSKMVGMIAVTRADEGREFDNASLSEMNRLCLYVSSRLSELTRTDAPALQALTRREREVSLLVAQGLTNHEIAEELIVSEHTVKQHLKSVFRKLKVDSRLKLASSLRSSADLLNSAPGPHPTSTKAQVHENRSPR